MRIVVHDYAGHPFQLDLSRELARRGHEVLHAFFDGDKGPKGQTQRLASDPETFSIAPIAIAKSYNKGALFARRRNDLDYGLEAGRIIANFRPDVVLSGNTPLDAQGPIQAATRTVGAAFVNWIQDFYSVAIRDLLSNRWAGLGRLVAARYAYLERRCLRASEHIVVISDDFRALIKDAGVPLGNVTTIPNWGAIKNIPLRPKANAWAEAHGLECNFVFAYSGTLGLKHDPRLLLQLAKHFEHDSDVVVVVAGAGLGYDQLKAWLSASPCANLRLFPLIGFADYPDFLATADVLVGVLEKEAGRFSVPSKVLSYLCAGRPILLSASLENQAARLVTEVEAGQVTPPDDPSAFLRAAEAFHQSLEARRSAGARGRAYAKANFDIVRVADKFEQIFKSTLRIENRVGASAA